MTKTKIQKRGGVGYGVGIKFFQVFLTVITRPVYNRYKSQQNHCQSKIQNLSVQQKRQLKCTVKHYQYRYQFYKKVNVICYHLTMQSVSSSVSVHKECTSSLSMGKCKICVCQFFVFIHSIVLIYKSNRCNLREKTYLLLLQNRDV